MKRTEIEEIRRVTGDYASEALKARQAWLELRLKQDPEIRKLFVRVADGIADELKRGGSSMVDDWLLERMEAQLSSLIEQLNTGLTLSLERSIAAAVDIGSRYNRAVTIDLMTQKVSIPRITKDGLENMFVRINESAVQAYWSRTRYGMKLSERIWDTSQGAGDVIRNIVQDGIAKGQDAITTARALEAYVRGDANVMSKYYEGMMSRMKGRVPEDLSYQALRTARSETTAALGQGAILSARASPSCKGIKFCLSPAHRVRDVCDELARHDVGLGPGVYPLDDPPPYPAHPNTLSYLIETHETPKDFTNRLRGWIDNPNSQPALNDWYATHYMSAA
ncbi:retron-type reverse transcriptase [Paenibacillus sp. NPDC057967]|uniref:retron-type reverse transcriptase n=1 Tax=Paenibacillus sp. NPDC057967 TaxID=3346293 RepID=UPI0036DBC14F